MEDARREILQAAAQPLRRAFTSAEVERRSPHHRTLLAKVRYRHLQDGDRHGVANCLPAPTRRNTRSASSCRLTRGRPPQVDSPTRQPSGSTPRRCDAGRSVGLQACSPSDDIHCSARGCSARFLQGESFDNRVHVQLCHRVGLPDAAHHTKCKPSTFSNSKVSSARNKSVGPRPGYLGWSASAQQRRMRASACTTTARGEILEKFATLSPTRTRRASKMRRSELSDFLWGAHLRNSACQEKVTEARPACWQGSMR